MDASSVGNTTVTVAVSTTRGREPAILNSIYEHGDEIDFKPFYHKANDFEYGSRREFSQALIRDQREHMAAFAHVQEHDANADTQQVEAVHSAIHVDDFLTEEREPLVIVDGNEQQATPFVRALSGLRSETPTVAHCLQSEYYYPTALLADLASNHLAHSIENDQYDSGNPLLPAPRAKSTRSDEWGKSFSAMYRNGREYTPPEIHSLRGESVRERICCWYEGAVALDGGADRPLSNSLNPAVQALRRDGFDELAEIFAGL